MLQRIKSRITPSGVIATIALFAALGGGYATAFKGSGSLKKAGENGLAVSFHDLRSLPGFGVLRVRCDDGDDEMEYQLRNTSSVNQFFTAIRDVDGTTDFGLVPPDETVTLAIGSGSVFGTMRIHVSKTFTTGNKHQVDILATNEGPGGFTGGGCDGASVRVMALTTVE